MERILLSAAWLISVVYASIPLYWFMTHPLAHYWRRRRTSIKVVGPLWFAVIAALVVVTFPFRTPRAYAEIWPWFAASPLIAIAVYIYRRVSRSNFDRATLVGQTELDPTREQKLYTGGLHARLRHPIYMAHLLHLGYWTFASGLAINYLLLLLSIPLYGLMIVLEERELVARFGDAYRDYQRRVPALIPRIRA